MQAPNILRDPSESEVQRSAYRVPFRSIVVAGVVFWAIPLIGLFFSQYIDILLVVFLAILFSTFLSPLVNGLARAHINRGIAILLIYLFALGVIAFVGQLALPLFIDETQRLAQTLPSDLQTLTGPLKHLGIKIPSGGLKNFNISSLFSGGGHQVAGVAGQAVGLVFTIGQAIVFLLAILVMTFFLTVRKTFTADVVNVLVPPRYRERSTSILSQMGERMGRWALGQIAITIYYAVAFSIGLALLNVPYAISVGVITGLLEIIPFVGGFIGVLLAVLVAASVHPLTIIWVIVLYLIVTNVEAHILVPLVYGRAVNLHPFLVIVALLIGAKAFGLLGALIAVPLAAALQVGVENLYIRDVVEAAENAPARRAAIDVVGFYRSHRPRRHGDETRPSG